MAKVKKALDLGIILKADDVVMDGIEGEIKVGATSKKLHAYLDGAAQAVVTEAQTQTLTNKTLTAPAISSPTGLVKADVGLGNVDNTSDATKNAAVATLTNKTLTAPVINSPTGIVKGDVGLGNVDNTSDATKDAAVATLTNKTLTAPVINSPTGIVKADVGLGNVDNTSDATKNAAIATLTNKTLTSPVINSPTGIVKGDVGLGNVDNTSDATKDAATATLTNKTLTSPAINTAVITTPSIVTPSRSDVKQDTFSNLTTYASTASNGQLAFATDSKSYYGVTDSALVSLGGAGGGFDTFVNLDATELLSNWASGDNAAFLGGGTLAGTFAKETVSPLNGIASYKYTQAASSLDDYIASPIQAVPVRFRGNTNTFTFSYLYNGSSTDIEPVVYDVTNATKLNVITNLLPATGTNASIYKANISIPSTCTQIRVGFQVKALNSGKILSFDDVQVSSDTTKYADPGLVTDWQSYTPTFVGFGTVASSSLRWRRVGSNIEITGKFTAGSSTAVVASITLPSGLTASSFDSAARSMGTYVRSDGAVTTHGGMVIANPLSNLVNFGPAETFGSSNVNPESAANGSVITGGGGAITIAQFSVPIAGLSASNPMIVTATDEFSTDTASLVYAPSSSFTLATLPNSPVGTFLTYTYAIADNTPTQTTTAPTQTTSDMNTNGMIIYTRTFTAASTAALPARFEVNIGKGFKGTEIAVFKSAGKVTVGTLTYSVVGTSSNGIRFYNYNENTGILTLDAGIQSGSVTATATILFSDGNVQTSGYLVVNASKSPSLVGIPQVQPRFATIKDVKGTNVDGGTSASNAYQTRTLNTLSDPTGIVTSLVANQFTLPAGTYFIEASAPGLSVNAHSVRLRNITDSTSDIIGNSGSSTSSVATHAFLLGNLTITAAKVFEIQHYTQTAVTNVGLGLGNPVESSIHTQVKVTKVK